MLQCQMLRLHDKLFCYLKLGLICFFFTFMRPDSFLFVFAKFVKLRQTVGNINDMTCGTMLASLSKHARSSSR